MDLYDKHIEEILAVLRNEAHVEQTTLLYNKEHAWPRVEKEQLIMLADTALELGHNKTASLESIIWTEKEETVQDERITLYGPDVAELAANCHGQPVSFGKIVLLASDDDIDEEEAYEFFENIDIIRYSLKLEGYMLRGFFQHNREWSRISKDALTNGFNFETLGTELIRDYKKLVHVKAVEVIFFTDEPLINRLKSTTAACNKISSALNKIADNIIMDCGHCSEKAICDEIGEMKEMHKKRVRAENEKTARPAS